MFRKVKFIIHGIAFLWIIFATANVLEIANDTIAFSNEPIISHAYAGECSSDCSGCFEGRSCRDTADGDRCGLISNGDEYIECHECQGSGGSCDDEEEN